MSIELSVCLCFVPYTGSGLGCAALADRKRLVCAWLRPTAFPTVQTLHLLGFFARLAQAVRGVTSGSQG